MSNKETIRLSRVELYELVWKTPLTKLSKEYNLSDVGLSKICKRHRIPTPPPGYWAKIASGYSTKRTPLPESLDNSIEIVDILKKPADTLTPILEKYSNIYEEFGTIQTDNPLQIISSLDKLHPLLRTSYKKLKVVQQDEHSRLWSNDENTVDLMVSKLQLDRSMKFLHTLFTFLEFQGFKIIIKKVNDSFRTYVVVHGVEIQIRLNEKVEQQPIDRSKVKETSFYWGPKYTYHPTGMISLRIENVYILNLRKEWRDGKKDRLEDKIVDIAEGVLNAAIRDKINDLERLEEDERRAERERVRNEKKAALELERHKRQKLFSDSQNWTMSQNLRNYIDATIRHYKSTSGDIEPGSEFEHWIHWAQKQADDVDPLKQK